MSLLGLLIYYACLTSEYEHLGINCGSDAHGDTAGLAPGWTTRTHKRYISKDRAVLKQLEDACRDPSLHNRTFLVFYFHCTPIMSYYPEKEASAALHRHLSSRTAALLVPLQRYLQTLIPTPVERANSPLSSPSLSPSPSSPSVSSPQSSPSPPTSHQSTLAIPTSRITTPASSRPGTPLVTPHHRLKSFSVPAFMASLKVHGSPLPFKSTAKQQAFYERWVRTPAFGVWLARQEEVVHRVLGG